MKIMGNVFQSWLANMQKHEVTTRSSAVAFNIILSLAPLVLLALTAFGWLEPTKRESVFSAIDAYVGPAGGELLRSIGSNTDENSYTASLSGLLGLALLFFSASTLFVQLRAAMDKISEGADEGSSVVRALIKDRISAIAIVFGFIVFSALSVAVNSAIGVYVEQTDNRGAALFTRTFDFLIFFGLFIYLYSTVPSQRLHTRATVSVAALTTLLFHLSKYVLSLYFKNMPLISFYGAAGSLVVVLLWGYVAALILLASFELGSTIVRMESGKRA